jgi:hypothetical protein
LFLDGGRRLFTAGDEGKGRVIELAPTALPTEVLRQYARAVCSHDIDSFEAIRKLNKDQVGESLRSLRARHPEFFAP